MSDRLEELRLQRALQREQLDRIDREIAALEAAARAAPGAEPPELAAMAPAAAPAEDIEAEAILREYAQPTASIEKRTKLGCALYLAVLLALLALGVVAVYLHARAARGH